MKTIRICVGCGLPVPNDAPGGICPECLLKSNVPGESDGQEPTPTPIPGETFGEYRIVRLLGHGGMGRVYEAEHTRGGRRVALKVIGQSLASEADRKRFLREGRLAAAVNHPNVVYIHGSEEIEGVPIIAMELVHGGTLKDRLKREGTLSVRDAVESAIQIIDGLEAAEAAGVLHRDIKPANCFVAQDGTVKVGDFGLSVSTLARGESLLTATGAVMGTPAYASPEQLRGEELDVRSDIYSVGATLYHLLTGRTPFAATDFVKLITEVLDKQPVPPNTVRSEIPVELSRVVSRCLAKDRKARFQTYSELREALLPFRHAERVPANPGVRFLASVVDEMIAYLPSFVFLAYWALDPLDMFVRDRTWQSLLVWLAFYGWYVAYYTICEGLWGSGLGKTLCGVRVVDETGQAPGIVRAFWRSVVYVTPSIIPSLVLLASMSRQELLSRLSNGDILVTDWLWIPFTLGLFITMRRRNGFAAVHDLLSRTRVIVRPRTQPRPRFDTAIVAAAPASTPEQGLPAFSPYETRSLLWRQSGEELWLAFDPALRRAVWIHTTAEATPNLRRDLSRPTRLRWLNGGTHLDRTWDAYEAPAGAAFHDMCGAPQPWNAVRFWLTDLAEEAAAAHRDPQTAAPLSLDRLWITPGGRALLLDFHAPSQRPSHADPSYSADDPQALQAFLDALAAEALGGRSVLPMHAQHFLDALRRRAFDRVEFIPGNLHSLLAKPAELTRPRRVASLALVPAIALFLGLLLAALLSFERLRADRIWAQHYPELPSLRLSASIRDAAQENDSESGRRLVRDSEIYMAQQYQHVLTNSALWNNPDFTDAASYRKDLQVAVDRASNATSNDVARATSVMADKLRTKARDQRLVIPFLIISMQMVMIILSMAVALAVVVIFGVNPVLHIFGIVVVNRQGQPAGRARLLLRWAVSWVFLGLLAAIGGLCGISVGAGMVFDDDLAALRNATLIITAITAVAVAVFAIHAMRWPTRSISDLICGTRLVPR